MNLLVDRQLSRERAGFAIVFKARLPGGDLKLNEHVLWSLGVGIGATSAGNRLVYKSRIEIEVEG